MMIITLLFFKREMVEARLLHPELQTADEASSSSIRNVDDLVKLLSFGQCWGLWSRSHMIKLLSKENLIDICFNVTRFGEPMDGAAADIEATAYEHSDFHVKSSHNLKSKSTDEELKEKKPTSG